MHLATLLYTVIASTCLSEANEHVRIPMKDGINMIGTVDRSYDGRNYFSFTGIPFAQPPTGEHRFEPPLPLDPYNKDVDATKIPPACAQGGLGINMGEEDCLYLDIFTPKLPDPKVKNTLPVIVWLHGGSFIVGSASIYKPHLLMDRDVVLVIPQYRLGLLGYLTSGSMHSSGNQGALDQIMALRWVQDNIHSFNGDPKRVTLAGDCAGGASALYHLISPLSKGLFHGVVSLSGSPLSPWARHSAHRRFLLMIGNKFKCPNYDLNIIIKCLKEIEIAEFLEGQQDLLEARDLMVGNDHIAPTVQARASAHVSTLFLEEDPIKILAEKEFPQIPVLMSVTRNVGSYLADMVLYEFFQYNLENDPEFVKKSLLPMMIKESGLYNLEKGPETDKYKNFYFPNNQFEDLDEVLPELAVMLGDTQFYAGILQMAKYLSKWTSTRLLKFEYEGGPKLFSLRHPDPETAPPLPLSHVGHGDELFFILPENRTQMTEEQRQVSNHFLDIISDFAYNKNSRIEGWKSFTEDGLESLSISPTGGLVTDQLFVSQERAEILSQTYQLQFDQYIKKIWPNKTVNHDEL